MARATLLPPARSPRARPERRHGALPADRDAADGRPPGRGDGPRPLPRALSRDAAAPEVPGDASRGGARCGARLVIAITSAVKESLVECYGSSPGGSGSCITASIAALPAGQRFTRAVPSLSRAQLAEQEPRPADRGVRALARGAPRAPAAPHRPRPRAARGRTASSGAGGCPTALVRLYQTASALVFPSLYEGFGQPRSRRWRAAALSPPRRGRDPGGVRRRRALLRPDARPSRSRRRSSRCSTTPMICARGLERAAMFSWEACARGHEAVFRELATS